jgi:hypothetical protein
MPALKRLLRVRRDEHVQRNDLRTIEVGDVDPTLAIQDGYNYGKGSGCRRGSRLREQSYGCRSPSGRSEQLGRSTNQAYGNIERGAAAKSYYQ